MVKQLAYAPMKEIFTRFHALEAEPKGELEHVNAFTLLVAVALSAQATDVGVNKATRKLFALADTRGLLRRRALPMRMRASCVGWTS